MTNEGDSSPEQDDYEKGVVALMEALGLPAGFYRSIYEERDWSFVIQLHALIETALMHAIEKKAGEELASIFARMPMNGPTGKVAVATKLGLLDYSDATAFLNVLSQMRNVCAHGIRNAVNFTIDGWLESHEHRDRIVTDLCGGRGAASEIITLGGKAVQRGAFARQNPKIVLYWLGGMLVGQLYEVARLAAMEQEKAETLERLWQLQRQQDALMKPIGLFQLLGQMAEPTDGADNLGEGRVPARPAKSLGEGHESADQ
ncbi:MULTISPECIES: hypothetical protein [unclassified Burkholderia]|uniref:hypothetical protein n=1 Tax=unclassified Burkholderia TaxID=2613784 RepID=UPI0007592ECA|nr:MULTISPECIES: hypothetical protein [unclassified Burkholderia]KUY96147.1 hypothetical protein WS48_16865 [Burkholderia sp. RF7-non_BP1]KUY98559.1 hypothetical protein WS49_19225 [Burkholderia sp. RF7-non_BP4]